MDVAHTQTIELPLSKSIVNRLLTLFALRGQTPESVGFGLDWSQQADDIQILHRALFEQTTSPTDSAKNTPTRIDIANCGTAMRFLTAYFAQQEGRQVMLTGCERMQHRPIGQLVEALRSLGADIEYLGREGYPPLRITGKSLEHRPVHIARPLSTQFISALLLIGIPATTDTDSPYITLTQEIIAGNPVYLRPEWLGDWSAAAFWYEYIALHGGSIRFTNLANTGQGDQICTKFFAHLGVKTLHSTDNISHSPDSNNSHSSSSKNSQSDNSILIEKSPSLISKKSPISRTTTGGRTIEWDFRTCPDLYPAAAIACEQLGIRLIATGTESLPLKESDRLRAVVEHKTYDDHRIAMALLAADLPCDNEACVLKSYPQFVAQLHAVQAASHKRQ